MSSTFSQGYRWPTDGIMASSDKFCICSACPVPPNQRPVVVVCTGDFLWHSAAKVQQALLPMGWHGTICLLSTPVNITASHTQE
ncbi:hypothetical protein Cfor_06819 [Coptotermes formosanus]|uniref:Uncharacterized protein n=1 Tax=Coptotermes formosanus TaxID=36987 RepID=A0A6L2Q854_COPFO|nr:hypothetical protein Cfor_06819 [Coptotermes formosanus]